MKTVFLKTHHAKGDEEKTEYQVGFYENGDLVYSLFFTTIGAAEKKRQELLKMSDKEINEHFARPRKTVRPFSGSRYTE